MPLNSIQIHGKVVHGSKYGRKLGFPTANLERRSFSRRKTKIKLGIYSGQASLTPHPSTLTPKLYKAAIIIGPIDKTGLPKLEVHLLNFKGNLYGKYLYTYINRYIREFRKFKSEAELKAQIRRDIQRVREIEI